MRVGRSEEHTSELQSLRHLVCRLLLEKKTAGRGGGVVLAHSALGRAHPLPRPAAGRAAPDNRSPGVRVARNRPVPLFFFLSGGPPPALPPPPTPAPFPN